MALQFIDQGGGPGAGIGSAERRIIRSHVMKGKNAGRPRRSMRKQTTASYPVKRVLTWSAPSVVTASAARPRQLLWSDLSLTSFPQQLDSESTRLMHRWFFDISDELFPPQFCSKFDIIKSIWVNCILQDEAYFHSTLAISASYVDFYQRKPSLSLKTLHHIAKAYELVNIKLSGPESVSDSAIAAVVALIMYQQVHNQHYTGLVHLHGLYQMIRLRGGIYSLLEENRVLALKALRVDAELALQTGSRTLFGTEALSNAISPDPGILDIIKKQFPNATPPKSSFLMLEAVAFSGVLNRMNREASPRLDPLCFMEMMIWLLYRLVDAIPQGQPRSSRDLTSSRGQYEEVANLGILAFMTTLLPEFSRTPDRSGYPLLGRRLKSAIQDLHFTTALEEKNRDLSLLLLWALFVSGVSVMKGEELRELSPLILETSTRLHLCDWPAVLDQLCQFPWIRALHDRPGLALWETSQQRGHET
ncbi:hypothetical protein N8I77_002191 [Diaporthe amygdali]|uniref:Uncharacterized protein n=1 Tax=Phomopsis amygdali TaxID=1214568 RepID=A0AAD9W8V3_PHOAM|nr:hypothetical protein N8I77_002191 [Diaporthe amygdali]